MTQPIYSFDSSNLPANQPNAAGSTWDFLADLDGIWGTTASKSIYQAGDGTGATNGWLETPNGGNAPNGQAWNQAGQACLVQWDPAIVGSLAVILHAIHDGASPPTGASRDGYRFNINPNTDGTHGSLSIARVSVVIDGGLIAIAFPRITGKMQAYLAVQALDSGHTAIYGDIRAAATPGNIALKLAYPFFGGSGESTAALQSASGNPFKFALNGGFRNVGNPSSYIDFFKVYAYDGVISNNSSNVASATNLPVLGSDLSVPTAALTVGSLTRTSVGFAGTGGRSSTPPVTSQWGLGTVGTPATALPAYGSPIVDNAGTGANAAITVSGLTPGTYYAAGLKSTDSFSGAGGPVTAYTAEFAFRTWLNADLAWLFLGDSIYANAIDWTDTTPGGTSPALARSLADEVAYQTEALLDRRLLYTNQAQSGSRTDQWLIGATEQYLANALAAYAALIAANSYAGPKWASIMLGANDSFRPIDAATYGANLRAICNTLIGGNGFAGVVVHYPSPGVDGGNAGNCTPAAQALLVAYQAQVDALPAAVAGVRCGDRSLATQGEILMRTAIMQRDGLHPFTGGLGTFARAHSIGNALAVNPAALGTTGGGFIEG